MKKIDEIRRTPFRQYNKEPEPETRIDHSRRFRKRYFDLPSFKWNSGHAPIMLLLGILLLVSVNGSAPLGDVPSVQERFQDWAEHENEKTVQQLPGDTPSPDSEYYEAYQFNEQTQENQLAALNTPTPAPEEETQSASSFKLYQPGELHYESDKMKISIEQKSKDGMMYFVCDIQLTDVSQFRTAFAGDDFRSGVYESVSDIAERNSPVLAINADFCRYHRDGIIIRNGQLYRKQNINKHHLLIVDKDGNLSARTDRSGKQGIIADKLMSQDTWQTFEFGPVLVENGEAVPMPKNFYVSTQKGYDNPRTAIGQIGPLHYIVIVVDGRRTGYSTGADLPQLQQLFIDEGAEFAFNLDGGGSTTLYFLGKVVNMPSSGKERSVSDIIMFMANPK